MANNIRNALEAVIRTRMYAEILQDALEMSQMSACAGLFKVDEKLWHKGASNHFGVRDAAGFGYRIPPRRWLDAGTGMNSRISEGKREFSRAFKEAALKHISVPQQTQRIRGGTYSAYGSHYATTAMPALSGTYMVGPKRVMKEIAKAMADNMIAYIDGAYGVDNADTTIKQKGFNHPLLWTGELITSIERKVIDDRADNKSRGSRSQDIDDI